MHFKCVDNALQCVDNTHTVNEYLLLMFDFADEIRSSPMNEEDILVSYDVQPFLPMYHCVRLLISWSTKLVPTIGLIKRMTLILRKRNLLSSLKLPQPTNFSSSMVNCMSRVMV